MYSLTLHVRRSLELQKWRNLSVTVKGFQNATSFFNSFSSDSNPLDARNGDIFTISYLVESLGLTTTLAESISKKVRFEDKSNPDSVLNLFRSYGFTESQISSIVTNYPGLLIADAEKSLGPNLQFLQSRGASNSEFTEVVSKVPEILGKKAGKSISRYYDFIKEIIEADKSFNSGKFCHSLPQGKQENKIRNVSVLRDLGVPQQLLFPLLISNHQPVCGKKRFEETLKKVIDMGFDPTNSKFVVALRMLYRLSDKTIEEKFSVYKRLGLDVGDLYAMFKKCPSFLTNSEKKITQTFETLKKCGLLETEILSVFKKCPRLIGASEKKLDNSIETFLGLGFSLDEFVMMVERYPYCILLSAETVKKKTEFVVKKMNWSLKDVASTPTALGYTLEKRTVPRCNVIKALMSKGLIGSELPHISTVLACTDQAFLNKYVMKHGELVPELIALFSGKNRESFRVK